MKPQNKIMPSTAKQAETNAFESVRATPFTRVHRRPTRRDYEVLKEEACTPASEVDDITYAWIKNVTDNYGLLADILGVDEYDKLPFRQEKKKNLARSYFTNAIKNGRLTEIPWQIMGISTYEINIYYDSTYR